MAAAPASAPMAIPAFAPEDRPVEAVDSEESDELEELELEELPLPVEVEVAESSVDSAAGLEADVVSAPETLVEVAVGDACNVLAVRQV